MEVLIPEHISVCLHFNEMGMVKTGLEKPTEAMVCTISSSTLVKNVILNRSLEFGNAIHCGSFF